MHTSPIIACRGTAQECQRTVSYAIPRYLTDSTYFNNTTSHLSPINEHLETTSKRWTVTPCSHFIQPATAANQSHLVTNKVGCCSCVSVTPGNKQGGFKRTKPRFDARSQWLLLRVNSSILSSGKSKGYLGRTFFSFRVHINVFGMVSTTQLVTLNLSNPVCKDFHLQRHCITNKTLDSLQLESSGCRKFMRRNTDKGHWRLEWILHT